jgi:hypothetical protein
MRRRKRSRSTGTPPRSDQLANKRERRAPGAHTLAGSTLLLRLRRARAGLAAETGQVADESESGLRWGFALLAAINTYTGRR